MIFPSVPQIINDDADRLSGSDAYFGRQCLFHKILESYFLGLDITFRQYLLLEKRKLAVPFAIW
ncbi:hypothetical protein WJ0W_001204 [Paenibacillus melissococcoides]|uniref:Uncharacterized protein n=1 Tax=Paenibacillus melissococcoides TaxID=2912268 RepID=A0ABM9FXT4_9BACL|nr:MULTISPECIES: hypothetical protein [Paenibacillus]MEB9893296.1 hypothetical protein [Bacillus cereus]CAH8243965.1 hypothetical protein WJ0W_001204 [Paenibacillus melissococcoides]CAH8704126.1 hypothetical protein HTL2_000454 [Paenibacillus melissococcoides]CAH8706850.1 hypothetical protein WDD9_001416 [Paenibacillus melissococcoides]GIO81066.1 hypothetical protein J6TS7_46760 [Paenibacillus dendritiformis]